MSDAILRDQERIINEYYYIVNNDHDYAEEALRRILVNNHEGDYSGVLILIEQFEPETCIDYERLVDKADLN